ncbi:MAG: hypothetical protein HN542_07560 [Flavobacteriales bacterium]|jgi:hypothetical protein|nr:hypothetical protein [Flavobacteriales bacterium]MBT4704384.1 hypothetical protein [Flavobacteriales bacterium]MBT4930460.1 hypothetical protein [Flavobacteriales bacterium]MBT5131737.1 hypothetical protein [Flavobacteriales bacterium]MBT6131993.1 hypothetical protein [Flavobacteriales bacterium]
MNGEATQIIEMHCICGLEKDVRGSKTVDALALAVEKMPQGSFLIFSPFWIKPKGQERHNALLPNTVQHHQMENSTGEPPGAQRTSIAVNQYTFCRISQTQIDSCI